MRTRGAGLAFALVAAATAGALIGYLAGGPYGRDATRRAIEVQSLPMGSIGKPIEVELPPIAAGPVRNVVLFIGDGMGLAQLQAARLAAFGPDGTLVAERFPVVGLARTSAVGAPVTESAASGTALATGVRTRPGRIGETPDQRPLRSVLEAARDAGYATGLVTTSSIFDATPATFATHVAERKQEEEIALQLSGAHVDLLIGGGRERFLPESRGGTRGDGRDLIEEARQRGTTIASNATELAAATRLPLWSILPGRFDRPGGDPPLAIWSQRTLELLSAESTKRGKGFFAMIEEEGADSAGHANDFEALAKAMLRLDAAVATGARFAEKDGATLVLVTGDHATGGLAVDYTSEESTARVAWSSARHSGEPVPVFALGPADAALRFGGAYHQTEIARRIAELLGLDLSTNWKAAG